MSPGSWISNVNNLRRSFDDVEKPTPSGFAAAFALLEHLNLEAVELWDSHDYE